MPVDPHHPDDRAALEREKWDTERDFRERELALKEREQQSREDEAALRDSSNF